MADYEKSWVVQSRHDGLTPFLRDRLLLSLYKSCQHRATALEDAMGLTSTIIAELHSAAIDGMLADTKIAHCALQTLQRFDKAAASHYQAFHVELL